MSNIHCLGGTVIVNNIKNIRNVHARRDARTPSVSAADDRFDVVSAHASAMDDKLGSVLCRLDKQEQCQNSILAVLFLMFCLMLYMCMYGLERPTVRT
jgi:predicted nucleic acid-binding Zn ribbon protein